MALSDDLVKVGGLNTGILKLVIRTSGVHGFVLADVTDEQHAVLRPEPAEKRVHLLRTRQARLVHDLRHAGATILMTLGVPDPIVRKVTRHRSRELERYQHLTPELRAFAVNLIATELFGRSGPGWKVAHSRHSARQGCH